MPGRGWDWDDAELQAGLTQFGKDVERAVLAAAERNAPAAEAWMKSAAGWTDRTGNARNGLKVQVSTYRKGVKMTFSHSVPYGIFLEVRWGGRYSVIPGAIQEWFPRTQNLIFQLLG